MAILSPSNLGVFEILKPKSSGEPPTVQQLHTLDVDEDLCEFHIVRRLPKASEIALYGYHAFPLAILQIPHDKYTPPNIRYTRDQKAEGRLLEHPRFLAISWLCPSCHSTMAAYSRENSRDEVDVLEFVQYLTAASDLECRWVRIRVQIPKQSWTYEALPYHWRHPDAVSEEVGRLAFVSHVTTSKYWVTIADIV